MVPPQVVSVTSTVPAPAGASTLTATLVGKGDSRTVAGSPPKRMVGRVPSDAILPRAYHELILVAPSEVCEDARGELERVTLALSRHLTDAGAFEA